MKTLTTTTRVTPETQALSELSAANGEQEVSASDTETPEKSPPWPVFIVFIAVAALILGLYGWSVQSATVLAAEFLVGTAALAAGALIGFLFGIPRGPDEVSDPAKPAVVTDYRPSNSLEQVADWLTKILVGAGLVQLSKLGAALSSLGATVTGAFREPPQGVALVSQLVAVVFVVYGFLLTFLWTRLYYSQLQALTDSNIRSALKKALESKRAFKSIASDLAAGRIPISTIPVTTEKALQLENVEALEWPGPVREKFERFKNTHVDWHEDTTAKIFGVRTSIDKGKVLEAECKAELGRALVINLRVRSLTQAPLDGPVTFCLHPSFTKRFIEVLPTGDRAETKITAAEWFTVVAILDNGETVLSLNLKQMPNTPDWFKLP